MRKTSAGEKRKFIQRKRMERCAREISKEWEESYRAERIRILQCALSGLELLPQAAGEVERSVTA